MTSEPGRADRELFDKLTAGMQEGPRELAARLELAYYNFDAVIHEGVPTPHCNDETVEINEYGHEPYGEQRQQTVIGIEEVEQKIFMARPIGALGVGRFVFGASFLYESDELFGKHRDTTIDKIIIAVTLEELTERITAGKAHVKVR